MLDIGSAGRLLGLIPLIGLITDIKSIEIIEIRVQVNSD